MNKNIFRISPSFEDIMPDEYKELVESGPYGKGLGVSQLGTYKELLEEHPLCAGCGLALSLRLILASLPNPEDTVIVGSTGCSALAFPQVALHNIHSLFGNQNAVASGLKRALKLRFPDKVKDVIVIAGDGATADIGLDMVMHSWFRCENIPPSCLIMKPMPTQAARKAECRLRERCFIWLLRVRSFLKLRCLK